MHWGLKRFHETGHLHFLTFRFFKIGRPGTRQTEGNYTIITNG
jgi:hypothetical protein